MADERLKKYRVQTKGAAEHSPWRTEAEVSGLAAAMREAHRCVEALGRGGIALWRTHEYVRVMQGDQVVAYWAHGRIEQEVA